MTKNSYKNVVLYSNNCPRCKVLKKKLDDAGIVYTTKPIAAENVNDIKELEELGVSFLPLLIVDKDIYDFSSAIKWLNEEEGTNEH